MIRWIIIRDIMRLLPQRIAIDLASSTSSSTFYVFQEIDCLHIPYLIRTWFKFRRNNRWSCIFDKSCRCKKSFKILGCAQFFLYPISIIIHQPLKWFLRCTYKSSRNYIIMKFSNALFYGTQLFSKSQPKIRYIFQILKKNRWFTLQNADLRKKFWPRLLFYGSKKPILCCCDPRPL